MLTGCFPCSLRVTPHNSLLQPRINNQVTPPRCRGGAASLDVKATTRPSTWGSFFHGLPTRDPQRCRTWLKAIQNPRFDENTPVSKYSGVRVCSLHFTAEDYEEDFRGKILNIAPKPMLKSGAVPSVFPGRHSGALGRTDTSAPAPKRRKIPVTIRYIWVGVASPSLYFHTLPFKRGECFGYRQLPTAASSSRIGGKLLHRGVGRPSGQQLPLRAGV
uniref:THAP-type domain-containing protein n=1 Tax=Amphiprion ocellaris TaxID=80972 RepID=A0AAQ5WYP8_AMPOC